MFTAPVETLLETPLNASSTGDDDNSTGAHLAEHTLATWAPAMLNPAMLNVEIAHSRLGHATVCYGSMSAATVLAGPATHKDDPPGVDVDPNQVPPADDQKGTDKGADQ